MKKHISHTNAGMRRIFDDLEFVFDERFFSREDLLHLRNNFHRLAPGAYHSPDGTGCIFGILTEKMAPETRITSRETLTKYFTGSHGETVRELPVYQPARWLVRAFDQQPCERYHGVVLDRDTLWEALEIAILARADEPSGAQHRTPPVRRVAQTDC
ncbi:MAG: hypothetical protein ABMA01_01795 [Chthoniobacteraceae bacterium]